LYSSAIASFFEQALLLTQLARKVKKSQWQRCHTRRLFHQPINIMELGVGMNTAGGGADASGFGV
jgi:hypothetical protein